MENDGICSGTYISTNSRCRFKAIKNIGDGTRCRRHAKKEDRLLESMFLSLEIDSKDKVVFDCCICLEEKDKKYINIVPCCENSSCKACAISWFKDNESCPFCRQKLSVYIYKK